MHFGQLRSAARSLRVRLAIWIAVAVFVVVGFTQVFVYVAVRRTLDADFQQFMKAEASLVNQTLSKYPEKEILDTLVRRSHRNKYHWSYEVYDENEKLLWSTGDVPTDPPPGLQVLAGTSPIIYENETHRMLFKRRRPEGKEPGQQDLLFRLATKKDSSVFALEDAMLLPSIMILAMAVTILVTPLGAYILAGRATRPLAKIIETTASLEPQNLQERLQIRGTGDELDQLSQTINGMLDRIASYIDRHRDFIADAAHELRSPLTAIRSSVEVALNRPRTTEEYQTLLSDVMEECSGLSSLVNRMLFLAEGDAGRFAARDQTASLDKLVSESLDMFQAVAESHDVELRLECLDAAMVRGEEVHLRQVVRNLIDNALKFTPGSGKVSVAVRVDPGNHQVRLSVADSGVGIPPDDLPRIFDRFYRADKSRHRLDGTGGYGLGLSICHSIITSLGGEIKVESDLGQGSTFTVILPLAGQLAAPQFAKV